MGYHSSKYGLVARTVNALTPEGSFSFDQNQRLLEHEYPFFDAVTDKLAHPTDRQKVLAKELTDDIVIGKYGQQQFGALWLNRHAAVTDRTPPLIMVNGFMGNLTNLDDKMRAFFLGEALPEQQILFVEEPSHGKSDLFTPEQRDELCVDGNATLVGLSMHRAINDFVETNIPDATKTILHGDSFGSRMSLEIAKSDSTTGTDMYDALQLFELPGTRNRRFRIHASYFLYEWLRSNNYRTEWLDVSKTRFSHYLDKYGTFAKPQPDFFHRDRISAARNFGNTILGRDSGLTTFAELVDHGLPITRIAGGTSRIDNPLHARREWQDLAKRGGFVLGILSNGSHDALGALSHARLRAKLIGSLTKFPLDRASVNQPFSFNLQQFSSNDTLQPLEYAYVA